MANNKNKKNKNGKKNNSSPKKKEVKKQIEKKEIKNDIKELKKEKVNKRQEEKKETIKNAKRELVYAPSNNDEITKLIKLIVVVTVIMIVFYFITTIVTRKANAKKIAEKEKSEKVSIQYENIIIGSMLNKEGDYYVLIEKENDDNSDEYQTLIQTVSVNDEAPKIYKANLTDIFNKIYLSDNKNYDSNLENFKVSGTTLIKVSNHQISETYDQHDSIKEKLSELK